MKKIKHLVLPVLAMFFLTSCDKEVLKSVETNVITEVKTQSKSKAPSANYAGIPFGVNIINNTNDYNYGYSNTELDALLDHLKANYMNHLSVRIIWKVAQNQTTMPALNAPFADRYNQTLITNIDRILSKADAKGMTVMLDFHTLFGDDAQSWQSPSWLGSITGVSRTINSEWVPQGSMRHIFYTQLVRDHYKTMVKELTAHFDDHPSVTYVSMMNEPLLTSASSVNNSTYFEPAFDDIKAAVDPVTGKWLSVRFMVAWSPWSEVTNRKLLTTSWRSKLDFVCLNAYFPWNKNDYQYDVRPWVVANNAATACKTGSPTKILIISESNKHTGAGCECNWDFTNYWKRFFVMMQDPTVMAYKPNLVQMWHARNDVGYFNTTTTYTPTNTGFNVLKAKATLADHIVINVVPKLH